jgi:hypothetical protein
MGGIMDTKSSSFWFFLILGVGVGLCFEMIKGPRIEMNSARFAFMKMEDEADEPAPASSAFRSSRKTKIIHAARPSAPAEKLAGLDPVAPGAEAGAPGATGDKAKEADKAASKANDKDKKKDKDKDKKKKKKKKKTVPGTGEDANKNAAAKDESKEPKADDADADSGPMGPGPSYATGPTATDENKIPQTLEEWENYLMGSPDFNRVSRFIRYFQTGVVKSDVFYAVIEKMLSENDDKMNELAVMALGSTPSPMSFSDLVKVTHVEAISTRVRKQAQSYLNGYMNIQYIRVLSSVLGLDLDDNDEHYVRLEAIRLMEVAAQYYLKGTTHTGGSGQPNQQSTTPSPAVKNYFSSLAGTLTRVSQNEPDSSVRSAAGQALTNLEELLGKS